MILASDSVRLRAVEPEDLELLYKWENEEANWKQSNTLVPYSRYTLKRYIANSHKSLFETGQLRLMIEVSSGKRTVGTIDLFDFDHFSHESRRSAYSSLIPATGRKATVSAALECIIRYVFETLNLAPVMV
jgi:diamine N-acetyltransferase